VDLLPVYSKFQLYSTIAGRGKFITKRKGIGKGGAKHHRKLVHDSIRDITDPAIRRLARRGDVIMLRVSLV